MKIETKEDILSVLRMPDAEFEQTVMKEAKELHRTHNHDRLDGIAMLGYTNICKNQCLYCGMRSSNTLIPRFRIAPKDALDMIQAACSQGFRKLFLVAGEDMGYGFDHLLEMITGARKIGMTHIATACGEFTKDQYAQLHEAGVDEYVLKFEMSDPETFNRLNPSTNFEKRMQGIQWIKETGMELASGNIVDFPGQSLEQMADDILLMKKLEISWAPVISYLPTTNTPLAKEGGPGSMSKCLKEISILRLMMPDANLTAQIPGHKLTDGLAGEEGNLAALNAGANYLFADLLPAGKVEAFHVVDNRITLGLDHIRHMADLAGMNLEL